MGILKNLTLRSLKLHRKRTIVTMIGIILSGAMIMGVASIAASFQDLFIQSAIQSSGNYHASFYDVDLDKVDIIAKDHSTAAVMLSRSKGYAIFAQSTDEYKPYLLLKQYDRAAFAHFPTTLVAGRLPATSHELLIPEEVQKQGSYQLGETITLAFGQRLLDGEQLGSDTNYQAEETFQPESEQSFTIAGVAADPLFDFSPGYTVFAHLDAAALQELDTVNVSMLSNKLKQIFQEVPVMAQNAGAQDFTYNNELLRWSGVSGNRNTMNFLSSLTLIIIALIVVGSVAVIYNAFAISVSERKKQFGMLASVGATAKQIQSTVFYEALLLGLIGIPLGIIAGLGGIGVTLKVVNQLMMGSMFSEELALRLVISPNTILITIAFEALTILLSAWLPAKRAARISPIEAIRLTDDLKLKGKEVKTNKLASKLLGVEGELALKNMKRNRKQYRATVFSLVISIVLFVTFSSFMEYGFISSGLYYGDIAYNVVVSSDYGEDSEGQNQFYQQVLDLPEVERAAVARTLYSQTKLAAEQLGDYLQKNFLQAEYFPQNEQGQYQLNVELVAIGEAEFTAYAAELGLKPEDYQDPQRLKGILLNKNVLDGKVSYQPLKVKAGTELSFVDRQYEADSLPAEFDLTIGALSEELPFGVNFTEMGLKIVVSDEVFTAIAAQLPAESQLQAQQAALYLSSSDSVALVEKIKVLEEQVEADFYLQDISQMQAELKRTTTVMAIFLYGFVTLITLIGVTNIFNTISTNVALRRREFAMLQSVGLTPQGLQKIIRFESLFYGFKALLYGLPLSILISFWMFNAFSNLFTFTFIIPWQEIIICILGVFLVTFLTMAQASAKFKQQNIITALGSELVF